MTLVHDVLLLIDASYMHTNAVDLDYITNTIYMFHVNRLVAITL